MQFGLLYECQRPFQGTKIDWNTLYKETLEQCELADQVGFNNLWFVEHHFLTGFSGSPSQDALFGALSRITKQIRIGYGVCILPYHHPVRVAERVALLDQLTDGRIELGTAAPTPTSRRVWAWIPGRRAACGKSPSRCSPRSGPPTSSNGKGNTGRCPSGACCRSPSSSPTRGCTWPVRPRTVSGWRPRRASGCCRRRPTPSMSWPISSKSIARPSRRPSPWARSSPTSGATTSTRSAMTMTSTPRTSPRQSMKTFFGPDKPYIQGRINAYEELLEAWGGVPDHLQADFGRWLRQSDDEHKKLAQEVGISLDSGPGAARAAIAQLDGTTLADRGVIIAGNPASCIKTCQMYEDIGVDQVMLIMQTETIPHAKVMGSIEKFGKEVIPAFQNAKATQEVAATF